MGTDYNEDATTPNPYPDHRPDPWAGVRRKDQLAAAVSKSTQFPANMPGVRGAYPTPVSPGEPAEWEQRQLGEKPW